MGGVKRKKKRKRNISDRDNVQPRAIFNDLLNIATYIIHSFDAGVFTARYCISDRFHDKQSQPRYKLRANPISASNNACMITGTRARPRKIVKVLYAAFYMYTWDTEISIDNFDHVYATAGYSIIASADNYCRDKFAPKSSVTAIATSQRARLRVTGESPEIISDRIGLLTDDRNFIGRITTPSSIFFYDMSSHIWCASFSHE